MKFNKKVKRRLRNRKKVKDVNVNRFRVTVKKSLNNLSAQIIDDKKSINILFSILILICFSCKELFDVMPPELEIMQPRNNETVGRTFDVILDVNDNDAIESVEIKLFQSSGDSWSLLQDKTLDTQPWRHTFSLSFSGKFRLRVLVKDEVGNFEEKEREFFISTSSTAADADKSVVSATPVYTDTRADTSLYTAGGIGETLDQPTTITDYYLHRIDGSDTSYTLPFYANASNHLQEFDESTFESLIQEWIRYTAASSTDGYKISYNLFEESIQAFKNQDIKKKFTEAIKKTDIVITTGGVSVGDADYIKDVVNSLGDINFWKVAVKPGRPLAFGKIKNTIFFGLPGNPVSVMVTFLLFVLPSIKLLSSENHNLTFETALIKTNLKKRKGRAEFQRGILTIKNNKKYVHSVGEQGSGILSSMAKANCLIYLPVEQGAVEMNDYVKVLVFNNYI